MSKYLPAKSEANKLRGATSNDTDARGSHEQTEVGDRFDALLEQLSTVIGIDDVLFCKGLLKQIFWMFLEHDGKFDNTQFGFVIASLQGDKPPNRTEATGKVQRLATHCWLWNLPSGSGSRKLRRRSMLQSEHTTSSRGPGSPDVKPLSPTEVAAYRT